MATPKTSLLVLVAFLQLSCYSTALKLVIEPMRFTGKESKSVEMKCNLDSSEAAAKEIMVLKISKKGEKALVILNPNNTITYVTASKETHEATGRIEDPVSKSYLNLVFKQPIPTDAGSYACYIYYMDESGALTEDRARSFLTVDDPDVIKLWEKVKVMMDEIDSREERVQSLTEKDVKFNERMKELEERIDRKYEEVKKNAIPVVAFSATTRQTITPKYRMAIVFDDVIMQQGEGYDGTRGVFTAPMDGVYVFYLSLETGAKKCMLSVKLMMNSNSIAELKVGDKNMVDQTSTTTVARLRPGDVIKTYVSYSSSRCFLTAGKRNVFSGFLVNPAS